MTSFSDKPIVSLRLPAVPASLDALQAFAREQVAPLAPPQDTLLKIQLALEEALVNIMHYAYPPGKPEWVELSCSLPESGRLRVEIRDAGRAFNPLREPPPDLSADLHDRPIGGLGIFLMRQVAAAANYCRVDGINVLTLDFNL